MYDRTDSMISKEFKYTTVLGGQSKWNAEFHETAVIFRS